MRFVLLMVLMLAACGKQQAEAPPPPQPVPADAVGHFCNMAMGEHSGPKGQIILKSQPQPVWFTSARDAIVFTMLPEEPKDIRAIYVSDMAKSKSWDQPDAWVDAKKAFFVIGSSHQGGMGGNETVPFSDRAGADRFAHENGGTVVEFQHLPKEYILGTPPGGGGEHHGQH